jgi:2-dehydro-3-deoxyphosphogluconate aldolase/(4S)-4-hydroxy-2-oxoglutarate aldolase
MRCFSWERFLKLPVVGILRDVSKEDVAQILPRYLQAGFTTIEIAMNTPNAENIIIRALQEHGDSLNIGAGTVCNLDDFEKACEAGSQFIVTPILDEQVINACVKESIPIFPGAYTPTEIYKAWNMGAGMVKVFPAASLGTAYLKELQGPLRQIKLLPTGGINIDNCIDFLSAGATGLGIGSQLFDKIMIRTKNWDALADHFGKFFEKISATKTH